jgi:cell division protein ZapA
MAQVTVTIAGQTYRIACAEGEEPHLERLAAAYGARIEEMRRAFGAIDDVRLHVMAAMSQADELHDAKRRLAIAEAELKRLRAGGPAHGSRDHQVEAMLAEGLHRAAERIEQLARSLNAPVRGEE